jgi:multidrug efflux pump subunit AcrA (membrane-fusion protein)
MVAITLGVAVLLLVEVVLPGYQRPTTRSYGTRLGYPALLRRLGRPLPVETAPVEDRTIVRVFLGEGTMASDPLLVPMIPAGKITGVYVQPGQRVHKGELLAELDARKGRLVAERARLAFESARAELRRVQVGSVMVLNREQPGKDAIDVQALREQLALLRDETAMKEKLYEQGLVSKDKLLEEKRTLSEAERALETANLSLQMSTTGKSQSERIAANNMQQAIMEWQERLEELNDFKIVAPADGIIDRVLIHPGEYNQAPGTPAFRIAAGLWFEGYFDQIAVGEIAKDAEAEVHLAARPERGFTGRVVNVNPIVSYGTGGPETSRPIRPVGTGAAEWPVTFRVRVELTPEVIETLVPGLTGFARVTVKRSGPAVPEGAMVSMSAGSGLVFLVNGPKWEVRRARYGAASDGWLEVVDGVSRGDKVIVEGQQVLEAGDAIQESSWRAPSTGRP